MSGASLQVEIFHIGGSTYAVRAEGRPADSVELDLESGPIADAMERLEDDHTDLEFFRNFGSVLFEKLFAPHVRQAYEAGIGLALAGASGEKHALRVNLCIQPQAARLYQIPWGLIYDAQRSWWLSCRLDQRLSNGSALRTGFSYYVAMPALPPSFEAPLRVLVISACPSAMDGIDATAEIASINKALAPLVRAGSARISVLERATRPSLGAAIAREQPHLVHVIAHGPSTRRSALENPGLYLEHPSGTGGDLCPHENLTTLLRNSEALRLVVLNACNSDGVAWKFAQRGVPALGMRFDIHGRGAESFSSEFYRAIGQGFTVDEAANEARTAIRTNYDEANRDWFAPTLFLPSGAGNLFPGFPKPRDAPSRKPPTEVIAARQPIAPLRTPHPAPVETQPARTRSAGLWYLFVLVPVLLVLGQHLLFSAFLRYPRDMVAFDERSVPMGSESSTVLQLIREFSGVTNLHLALGDAPSGMVGTEFLIDRSEVTNRRYREFLDSSKTKIHDRHHRDEGDDKSHAPDNWEGAGLEKPDLPVTGVDWYDAYAFCVWAGGRLPSGVEWERAARGTDGRLFPWGSEFDSSLAHTLEAGLKGPRPVGFVTGDRSPEGVEDLAGNVREWTAELELVDGAQWRVIRGGSWAQGGALLFLAFLRTSATTSYRQADVGFRCARSATNESAPNDDLIRIAGGPFEIGGDPSVSADVVRRRGVRGDLLWRLIKDPPREMRVEAFALDRNEVTNTAYRAFLGALGTGHGPCSSGEPKDKSHEPQGWKHVELQNGKQPVVGVDWYDASAYCRSVGKRLPTTIEFERAVRGETGRRYPWGEDYDPTRCNTADGEKPVGSTVPVGEQTRCMSREGVSDLVGNADEWTQTEEQTQTIADGHLVRGGSWMESGEVRGVGFMSVLAATDYHGLDMGFRCAADPRRSWIEQWLGL